MTAIVIVLARRRPCSLRCRCCSLALSAPVHRLIRSVATIFTNQAYVLVLVVRFPSHCPPIVRIRFGKWWWFQGMHLAYFSRRTLGQLLESVGFEVIQHQNYCAYFQLFSLAKSMSRYKLGRLLSPIFHLPFLRNIMVPVKLSGEMVLYAVKK